MLRRSKFDSDATERRVVPDAAAARLLARASELAASGEAGFALADLRAAAEEAGIPSHAFEAALAEEQRRGGLASAPAVGGPLRHLRRSWAVAAAGAGALLIALAVLVASPEPIPTAEEAIVLRCLAPGEAAELIRPLMRARSSSAEYRPASAPRVLTIRGTPDDLERAKARLAEHERRASSTCTTPPVATTSP